MCIMIYWAPYAVSEVETKHNQQYQNRRSADFEKQGVRDV